MLPSSDPMNIFSSPYDGEEYIESPVVYSQSTSLELISTAYIFPFVEPIYAVSFITIGEDCNLPSKSTSTLTSPVSLSNPYKCPSSHPT